MRKLWLITLILLFGCSPAPAPRPEPVGLTAADVDLLVASVPRLHPDPWHGVSQADFTAAAERLKPRLATLGRDQQLVELMRLVTLLSGKGREGHQGIFPWYPELDAYGFHAYPLILWAFPDGIRVVKARETRLDGLKLVSINGHPVDEVTRAIRPLVSTDSEATFLLFGPILHVVPEILHGLGLTDAVGPVTYTFEGQVEATLAPIPMPSYRDWAGPAGPVRLPPHSPTGPGYLQREDVNLTVSWLPEWSAVLVRYNLTLGDTAAAAAELRELTAAHHPRRVIVDLRHNLGGDNHTYASLLAALRDPGSPPPTVLIGRCTFSAAVNFATELDVSTAAVFVGEPTGGSPNLYADTHEVELRSLSVGVNISTRYWQKSTPDDPRLAIAPDVAAPITAADWLADRDPVLEAALR